MPNYEFCVKQVPLTRKDLLIWISNVYHCFRGSSSQNHQPPYRDKNNWRGQVPQTGTHWLPCLLVTKAGLFIDQKESENPVEEQAWLCLSASKTVTVTADNRHAGGMRYPFCLLSLLTAQLFSSICFRSSESKKREKENHPKPPSWDILKVSLETSSQNEQNVISNSTG